MIKLSEQYYLYMSCIGKYYILTREELAEREELPEYECCEMCGDCDDLIDTFHSIVDLACALKGLGLEEDEVIEMTGIRVITEVVEEVINDTKI